MHMACFETDKSNETKKIERDVPSFFGAPGGDRTRDLGLKRPLLYH